MLERKFWIGLSAVLWLAACGRDSQSREASAEGSAAAAGPAGAEEAKPSSAGLEPGSQAAALDEALAPATQKAWREEQGATTGRPGPANTIAWTATGVEISNPPDATSWTMLTRDVEVEGAPWVELVVRMRTEGVEAPAQGFGNCNAFVRHGAGLVPTPPVFGTTASTERRRFIELPPDTKSVQVGLFCRQPGKVVFEQVSLRLVDDPGWTEEVSGHYRYRLLPGAPALDDRVRAFNDESFELTLAFLEVEAPSEAIEYRVYADLEQKALLSGRGGNAHRDGAVMHSIFSSDRHEIVHVLADAVGDPPALLGEGLAVHLSGGFQHVANRAAAGKILGTDAWPGIAGLLTSELFRAVPDVVSYPVSGAFVEWVVETRGKTVLLKLFAEMVNQEPAERSQSKLEAALGADLAALELEFADWVRAETTAG